MEVLTTVLAIIGGILGCMFVILIDLTESLRAKNEIFLADRLKLAELVIGTAAVLDIFTAVVLSTI